MLGEVLRHVRTCNSMDELQLWFAEVCSQNGFEYFDLISFKSGLLSRPKEACEVYLNNYGIEEPWHFLPRSWPANDEVMSRAAHSAAPFDYFEALDDSRQIAFVRLQKSVMRINGVRSAWIMPYNTIDRLRCITVYSTSQTGGTLSSGKPDLYAIGAVLFDQVQSLIHANNSQMQNRDLSFLELSQEELACLRALTIGQSNNKIAEGLGISPNTVRYHLKKVFKKLQVTSRAEAAIVAINRGLSE